MTRSVVNSGTSPGRRFRSHGAALLAVLFGAATLFGSGSALAKKKKPAAADDTETPAAAAPAGEEGAAKDGPPAAQVQDVEKPKRIVDENQSAPKTDALGHVHFGSPNGEGLGRVAVKASPESKIKVFLEGRYFGTAPVTIYSVPKGDYIVEATYPTGKQVSRPVTVGENEETAVDLGGAATLSSGDSMGNMFNADMTPTRMMWTEGFLIGAGVGVITAVTFGILELKAESDYNKATTQNQQDDIAKKGKNYALLTNVGIVVTAVGLVGAGITGYPLVFKSGEKKTALVITPAIAPGLTGGVATLHF
jgi:hypothetical protein